MDNILPFPVKVMKQWTQDDYAYNDPDESGEEYSIIYEGGQKIICTNLYNLMILYGFSSWKDIINVLERQVNNKSIKSFYLNVANSNIFIYC